MLIDPTQPIPGEIYRNAKGATREVRSVDDDGYLVRYTRPPPAPAEWGCCTMTAWVFWIESTNAVRIRKAAVVVDKDWRYVANAE